MGRFTGRPTGVVLYEGPSEINGEEIVVIATFSSANDKTGNLIQTWIMSKDTHPIEAIHTGKDEAVCGSCPLRGIIMKVADSDYKGTSNHKHDTINRHRGCYVAVQNAPRSIWASYKKGNYPKFDAEVHTRWFRGRGLRYGAYGDPTAAPMGAWTPIMCLADNNKQSVPGYTHQWRDEQFQEWRFHIMASTHTEAETLEAQAMGWRTYRVRAEGEPLMKGEAECPATELGGYSHTCESCGACNGSKRNCDTQKASMSCVVHGSSAKVSSTVKVIQLMGKKKLVA